MIVDHLTTSAKIFQDENKIKKSLKIPKG